MSDEKLKAAHLVLEEQYEYYGCLFPNRCRMAGRHTVGECYDEEQLNEFLRREERE